MRAQQSRARIRRCDKALPSMAENGTERGRFELPLPLRADRFSKPAHSTTLPPLRDSFGTIADAWDSVKTAIPAEFFHLSAVHSRAQPAPSSVCRVAVSRRFGDRNALRNAHAWIALFTCALSRLLRAGASRFGCAAHERDLAAVAAKEQGRDDARVGWSST